MYLSGSSYTIDATATLYAVWRSNTYTVTYNANGGSGAPVAETFLSGQTMKISNITPVRSGYTFQGWSTSSTATTTSYLPGNSYTNTTNVSITLYAVWKVGSSYSVIYNANGATLGLVPDSQNNNISGSYVTLKTNTGSLRKIGFGYAAGWNTNSAGTGTTYSFGQIISMPASNLTLYAKWNAVGGTWTASSFPAIFGVYKVVYMPQSVAQTFYNVMSKPSALSDIEKYIAQGGATWAASQVAVAFGLSASGAVVVVGVVFLLYDINQSLDKTAFLDKLNSCPSNGFVVMEFWVNHVVSSVSTGQLVFSVQYKNATDVQTANGTFQEGVFLTN